MEGDLLGLYGTSTPKKTETNRPAPLASISSPALQHLRLDAAGGAMTPTSAAYQAHRAGRAPVTPRGNAFRRIGQLFAEGKINETQKGALKDAVISGRSLNTQLDAMLAIPKGDTAAMSIAFSAAVAGQSRPTSVAAKRRAKLTEADRADSFSNLKTDAPTESWWDDAPTTAPAPAPEARPRPAAIDTSSGGAGSRGRLGSDVSVEPEFETRLAGDLMVREGHLMLKKWRQRYVVLDQGDVFVYSNRREYEEGMYPIDVATLAHSMGLSDMKVANKKGSRIFYRHLFELKPGATLAGSKGHHRTWKWGATTMPTFERWTKAMRGFIDKANRDLRRREKDALALDKAIAPSELLEQARASPRRRARRRSSTIGEVGLSDGSETLTVNVHLLDGTPLRAVVHKGATVRDVLLGIRRELGLEADADFSLFIRDTANNADRFTVLPDSTLAEEADAAALADSKSLVYKRRIVLPVPPEGAHVDGRDVDTEEAEAKDSEQAAHKLAYVEAVFNMLSGNYLLEVSDAIHLAALKLVSDYGAAPPSVEALAKRVDTVMSAEAVSEAVVGQGRSVEDLMASVLARRGELTESDPFEAQQAFLANIRLLPEYGATFFKSTLLRYVAGDLDPENCGPQESLPDWLLSCTGEDKRHPPPTANVLVAVNAQGVFTRLAPPSHADLDDILRMHTSGTSSRRASDAGHFGTPSNWIAHHVQYVEVWGVKKTRPVFTYRVREVNKLLLVELNSPQFQEMANVLHMYVFGLLAQREGRTHATSRSGTTDYGVEAARQKEAAAVAEAVAKSELPTGWTEIRDPVTGKTAFWNSQTKATIFSRPTF